MGEITEMVLEGLLCSRCGGFVGPYPIFKGNKQVGTDPGEPVFSDSGVRTVAQSGFPVVCKECHEMTNSQPELKPCPFCGGINLSRWASDIGWRVSCRTCFATAAPNEYKEPAFAAWNRRDG